MEQNPKSEKANEDSCILNSCDNFLSGNIVFDWLLKPWKQFKNYKILD
jgi:hypothetical protein